MHLLPGKKEKWSTAEIGRNTNEEVERLCNLYMQWQMEVKCEMTGRAMGRHLINLYSNGVRKVLKIDYIDQLCRDIEEDSIIKYSVTDISTLMVSTFGKWLSLVFVACHTVNHTEGFATITKQEDLEEGFSPK